MAERRPLTARDVKGKTRRRLFGDVRRSLRAPLLLRPRRACIGPPASRSTSAARRVPRARSCTRFVRRITSLDKLELRRRRALAAPPRRRCTCSKGCSRTWCVLFGLRFRTSRSAVPGSRRRAHARPPPLQVRNASDLTRDGRAGSRPARVGDLEAAHDQVQLLVAARRDAVPRALAEPVCAPARSPGTWYVVGEDLDDSDVRTVPRLPDPHRHPLRHPARARFPPARRFDVDAYRVGRGFATRPVSRRRASKSNVDTAWSVHRTLREAGTLTERRLRDRLSPPSSRSRLGAGQNGSAVPLEPEELRIACAEGLRPCCATRTRRNRRSSRA